MKKMLLYLMIFGIIGSGCSNLDNNSANNTHANNANVNTHEIHSPQQPKMVNKNAEVVPQINTNTARSLKKFEDIKVTDSKFSKVEEIRGAGGGISELKINNRGELPSYYIYPTSQPDLNINNQQRNISSPTWQISW